MAGVQSTSQLQSTISNALSGKAAAISIVTVSVFALAAVAGVTTFFSPCAFPMFPGYMSLFLGLNVSNPETQTESAASYRGALRRALSAGSITALGMIIVFLIIGVALVFAANLIGGYIPYFLVIVGAILVGLGALLLTNLQYWRVVTPLQQFWRRLRGKPITDEVVAPAPATGQGVLPQALQLRDGLRRRGGRLASLRSISRPSSRGWPSGCSAGLSTY